ncbi:MAG: tyrosine-type recombinase/integrase [Hyphomicrobium sp.]
MVGQPLTDIAIRKLKSTGGGRVEIWDSKIPGFGLRAAERGTKSFVLVYRYRGRPRRLTLGRYPTLSLAAARQKATEALRSVGDGSDPQAAKESDRNPDRFEDAVAAFVEQYCRRHNRASTMKETERELRNRFVTRWANRDVREISKQDVLDVLDGVVAQGLPSAANHALAVVRKFFNWAVERGLVEQSPCLTVKKPARVGTRERVLTEEELAHVWNAARVMGYPFGPLVQLLMLTAQRRNEVAGMRWRRVDTRESLWSLPAELTKSNRAHSVPLAAIAIEVITACPRLHDELIFPSSGADGTTFSGFSKCKARLDAASGVTDWTLHDLRRTAATHMARLGVAPHVVERILNHTGGALGGVAGIYNRFAYQPEMRAALELWALHVQGLGSKTDM